MRLNLNLASQPYSDVRRFFKRWAIGLTVLALFTAVLMWAAITALLDWRTITRQEDALRKEIAERTQQKAQGEAFMARPENRTTRDRSHFLNELIARKAFSWTQVMSDLETIMPRGLHVVSIAPSINEQEQLELELIVSGSSRDRAVELVRQLESSRHFSMAEVRSETAPQRPDNPEDVIQFNISAVYVPSFAQGGR